MSILLKDVRHKNSLADILIEGNRFKRIALPGKIFAAEIPQGTEIVDCSHFAVLPAFYNAHTHAAMTLFRGAADDLPLMKWLSGWIWPMEKKLDAEAVYAGSRLAILEMIKSGTVFFSDMYWFREATIRAAEEMGIRATVGVTFAEGLVDDSEQNFEFLRAHYRDYSPRVNLAVMPHSVYTVGEKLFRRCADIAEELDLKLHLHLSETADEAIRSRTSTGGKSPVEYLDSRGILTPRTIAAHAVHLSDQDISILRERGVSVVHCPASNMKLASGSFRAEAVLGAGIRVALGTDGAASNNNLDMREEMKLAALLAKLTSGNPETLPASKVFEMATKNGAEAYGIDAGEIAEGKLADAILVDLENERLVPGSNLISDWVYSADSRAVDSVLCDGKFVMRGGRVENEEEIISSARKAFSRLRSTSL
jgi:5-methylthioadenosine/S-adenosylhomocysteine deaminase